MVYIEDNSERKGGKSVPYHLVEAGSVARKVVLYEQLEIGIE